MTTADRLLWLTDYAAAAQAGGTGPVPARLARGIRVEHLGFSYPGEPAPVLTDVNLDLPAGSTVALVGENGAGKSTLVKLLTGMYRPSSGKITVDGADLASIGPARWRASTTGAFQDFVQFHMTLGDGVGAGDLPRIDDHGAVHGTVTQAGAAGLVADLPDGLGTRSAPGSAAGPCPRGSGSGWPWPAG
jgi:ATP-binding cassette subfamily B protein